MKLLDFDKLMSSLTGFIETKVELIKFDIEEEVKKIVAKAVVLVFVGLTLSMAVFLLSIGLASFLNELLDNDYLGFAIVAAVYVLIALLVYSKREQINESIIRRLNLTKETEDDE